MVHGDVEAFGDHHGDGAVGVPKYKNRVGSLGAEHLLGLDEGFPQNPAERGGVHVEMVVGSTELQFLEEDLAEPAVVVLARVHENVLEGLVETGDHP